MKILSRLSKVMAIISILWAIAAAVYLLAFATATAESVEMSGATDQLPITTRTVEQIPFASYAGTTAVVAIIIFSSLLILGAVFAWKTALLPAGILSVLALVATYITGFTIGGFYFLGVVALCVSTLLVFVATRRRGSANP
jgi:hypothetical protein